MKTINKLLIGAAVIAGVAGFAFLSEYSHYGKIPSYLQKENVRENAYNHLKTIRKTNYSKPVEIDGKKYEITVRRTEHSFMSRRGLELEVKNLETKDKIEFIDTDDTMYHRKGNVGGVFYAEEPRFRSIDQLRVNWDSQWTNKQREEKMNEFLRPLEQDLKRLADAEIKREENIWKQAIGIEPDFIKILDVQYFPVEDKNHVPIIAIGMEGYDQSCPKVIHFHVDDNYIFSWDTPKTFDKNGKRIEEKELKSIKHGAACLPHEQGKSVTTESYNNLKKGTHTLTAVLEDYFGNTTKDTIIFEVK